MRRFFLGTAFILVAFGFYLIAQAPPPKHSLQHIVVKGETFFVDVATTTEEQKRGLMYQKNLPSDRGTLFIFSKTEQKNFWNKNTLIPLDVIWIRDGAAVGYSELRSEQERGIEIVSSPEPVDMVLEINRGWSEKHNLLKGDRLVIQ